MKVGIVFVGQGAQYPGMGKDLYDNYPRAKEIFDKAGDQIKEWCFEGSEETLKMTNVTQPTMYTVTMAAYEAFMEEAEKAGLKDRMEIIGYSGFSLGEYASLTAAGAIDEITKGLDVVSKRGQYMEEAGLDENGEHKGAMVAALGKRDKIEELVEKAANGRILAAVNYNSPKQTVVAGDKEAIADFTEMAGENRIKAIPLAVSTAFHSAMMDPAAERLVPVLEKVGFKKPNATVYSNITAEDVMRDYDGGDVNAYLTDIMARQIKSPVHFDEIVSNMAEAGVETIIEIGPGHTLSGLIKKINRDIKTYNVENKETLEDTIAGLKEDLGC
jgi:[acyl-carrier-protein] S-malonyltransferase